MRGFVAEWDGKKAYVLEVDSDGYGIEEDDLSAEPWEAMTRLVGRIKEECDVENDITFKNLEKLNLAIEAERKRHSEAISTNRNMVEKILTQINSMEYTVEPWKKP